MNAGIKGRCLYGGSAEAATTLDADGLCYVLRSQTKPTDNTTPALFYGMCKKCNVVSSHYAQWICIECREAITYRNHDSVVRCSSIYDYDYCREVTEAFTFD